MGKIPCPKMYLFPKYLFVEEQDALDTYLKLPQKHYNTGWVLSQVILVARCIFIGIYLGFVMLILFYSNFCSVNVQILFFIVLDYFSLH